MILTDMFPPSRAHYRYPYIRSGDVTSAASGRKSGRIVIPIPAPSSTRPEEASDDNRRYGVVWTVLNSLRPHDDRFEVAINRPDVNGPTDGGIPVGGGNRGPGDGDGKEGSDRQDRHPPAPGTLSWDPRFEQKQTGCRVSRRHPVRNV